jgi:alpha-D-ribose 1-methylphosphonate 5-triphosphate synthase subunit PhnL
MTTVGTILDVVGLEKRFCLHAIGRQVQALCDVHLHVASGEHVTLVGPSGAGKSTLLRCVWRSCLPTSGALWLTRSDGAVVDLAGLDDQAMLAVRHRDLGYVSQFLRPERRRPVLAGVGRAARGRGLPADEAADAAAVALGRVGLGPELWGTWPELLSGGEQQRVNLAIGTVVPPRLLLLDEPVASLDRVSRDAVLELVAELVDAGVGVLSVLHDLDAVRAVAHRAVLLADGRVVADGPPSDVLGHAALVADAGPVQ